MPDDLRMNHGDFTNYWGFSGSNSRDVATKKALKKYILHKLLPKI
jgi:hypothetical protein